MYCSCSSDAPQEQLLLPCSVQPAVGGNSTLSAKTSCVCCTLNVQCKARKYSAVQCTVHSAVQHSAVQCSTVERSALVLPLRCVGQSAGWPLGRGLLSAWPCCPVLSAGPCCTVLGGAVLWPPVLAQSHCTAGEGGLGLDSGRLGGLETEDESLGGASKTKGMLLLMVCFWSFCIGSLLVRERRR